MATFITKFRMDNGDTVNATGEWESIETVHAALSLDLRNDFVTITGGDGSKTLLARARIVLITINKVRE